MAITTYAELKTTIADYLNRTDLTSVIPTFIDLAQAQIDRDLRHWQMEDRVTTTSTDRYIVRPSDWVQTKRLRITTGNTRALELLSVAAMDERRMNKENEAGTPKFYCHIEDQFEVFPTPNTSTTFELHYYKKIPALSDSNTSNWLLAEAPDVYLYGSLLHTAPYLNDDQRMGTFAQLYAAAIKRLEDEGRAAEFGVDGLRMRRRGLDTGASRRIY